MEQTTVQNSSERKSSLPNLFWIMILCIVIILMVFVAKFYYDLNILDKEIKHGTGLANKCRNNTLTDSEYDEILQLLNNDKNAALQLQMLTVIKIEASRNQQRYEASLKALEQIKATDFNVITFAKKQLEELRKKGVEK